MAATKPTAEPVCLSQTNSVRWCQEVYETSTGHAEIRARQLRRSGYKVDCSEMGEQITAVGRLKMSLLDIRPGKHEDTKNLPYVRIERI